MKSDTKTQQSTKDFLLDNFNKKRENMKREKILVGFDILGNPYLLYACDTNGTKTQQSDKDFLLDDFRNFKDWREVLIITGTPNTSKWFRFRIDGSWDFTHTEFDYNIILTEVSE